MLTSVMPTRRVTSSSWGCASSGASGPGVVALLLGQPLEPRPAQREVGGLGAGEQRGEQEHESAEARASSRTRPGYPWKCSKPRAHRDRRAVGVRRTTPLARGSSISPITVSAVPVARPRPATRRVDRRRVAGQQELVVLAAARPPTRSASRAEGARRLARRRRRSGRDRVARGRPPPLSRQMCPRSVARPSEQSIMACTPRRAPSQRPSATRARGRRCAARDLGEPRAGQRRVAGAVASRSRARRGRRRSAPRRAGHRHRVARRGACERSRGSPGCSPSRVTLTIQPPGRGRGVAADDGHAVGRGGLAPCPRRRRPPPRRRCPRGRPAPRAPSAGCRPWPRCRRG